ncbi:MULTISPECIES: hypothetical protein [unclassified Streptomyces]|uniref:hypothetical protein n=1 Tax=unclassified Streptomyces TaxID=2593676 RepID=UPI003444C945
MTHVHAVVAPSVATVELSDATVTLTEWRVSDLAPDHYGITFREISGWLAEDYVPGSVALGTNRMVRADVPVRCVHAHNVNVQVGIKDYGHDRRRMTIQWRHSYDPAARNSICTDCIRREKDTPAPERAGAAFTPSGNELLAFLYESVTEFQATAQLTGLRHAQIRGYLAEHLAERLAARPVTEFLASHESFPVGRYTTKQGAVDHIDREAES